MIKIQGKEDVQGRKACLLGDRSTVDRGMQREKASLVVATHILYDNLVVNGKNVKLTS